MLSATASTIETTCTACGSAATKPDPFFYEWKGREWWIYRCRSCTHQFVFPPVGEEEQSEIYGDGYFTADGDWVCGIFGKSYEDSLPELTNEAHDVLDMLGLPTGSLLDIGCAGGVFLDVARSRGFDVHGMEINERMAEHARSTYDVPVLCSRIEDVPVGQWDGRFDIVTLLDVLEHVPAPLDAIRKVGEWTKPGGRLFIRGPLANDRTARIKESVRRITRRTKRLDGYPLDANAFNVRSMTAMLDACGYDVARWWPAHDFANMLAVKR